MANIIFDFDGTIADSFELIIDIIKQLTHVQEEITEKTIQEIRSQPISAVMKRLNVESWRLPLLLLRGRRMMGKRIDDVHIFSGMVKTIQDLHAEGHNLFIVSSNSSRNVIKFLSFHKIEKKFVGVEGSVSLFSKHKALEKIIRFNSLVPEQSWYVGDEIRDVVAAKSVNLRSIAVTWGFTDRDTLSNEHPSALADKPTDIMTILNDSSIMS